MTDALESVVSAPAKAFDLEGFVRNATWRELLMELVDRNELDPWDIDIAKMVESYVAVIHNMKVMDLFVPANIVLAASILLRMKSESISIFEVHEPVDEAEEPRMGQRVLPNVGGITPRARQQPGKHITLAELMDALDDAMKMVQHREEREIAQSIPVQFYVNDDDIDEKMERVYSLVKKNADEYRTTTFANLARLFGSSESILLDLFVPLLFLAHKGRVSMKQDSFFDEIFVMLGERSAAAG